MCEKCRRIRRSVVVPAAAVCWLSSLLLLLLLPMLRLAFLRVIRLGADYGIIIPRRIYIILPLDDFAIFLILIIE